ncbi:MAG: hypothetical protein KBA03_01280 [Anaerolineaceae bacterium]|nr:hypothetical protein [Anaerolineaceae bacterium]
MLPEDKVNAFIAKVQESSKYAQLDFTLVKQIAIEELRNQKDEKTALKTTRTRLHRLAGAFITTKLDYTKWQDIFKVIPADNQEARNKTAKQMMKLHASTQERLPFLESFYQQALASIAPVHSVLDLACGLNPLAIPWMPLAEDAVYYACDVVKPMLGFIENYFEIINQNGEAFSSNLLTEIPSQKVELAIMLKLLPILDQVNPNASKRLLDSVQANHFLISYPSKSLGGREKGMKQTYAEHFARLVERENFSSIQHFEFPNETVYLISK